MRRTAFVLLVVVTFLAAGAWELSVSAQANGAQATPQENGIANKRPIFGGACPACPWGAAAQVVKDAMAPLYGYDVQICWYCAGSARAARLIADKSDATPPQRPTPDALPTPKGRIDFGATGSEFLEYAWLGIHDFAHDKEGARKNLRLIAHLQMPSYFLVAVNPKSGITDLRQITGKKMAVKLVARGGQDVPINRAVLEYYGLSPELIKSFGGTTASGYTRGADVDVIIGYGQLVGAPEYDAWYTASQQQDLTFLDLPADLRDKLVKDFYLVPALAPVGLLRGLTRRVPTVARDGIVIYGRDDMPDSFAYDVAKALDEQKAALQWSDMPISYNEKIVWKNFDVPLHPGAAKYYRERGYLK